MTQKGTLTITSLLSVFLFQLHWVDEVARGIETAGVSALGGVLILVVWLYGTVVLGDRRSGHIIMVLGSILGFGVLVIHMRGGTRRRQDPANSSGAFFCVWTLIMLGVMSSVSAILSARGLWSLRGQSRAT